MINLRKLQSNVVALTLSEKSTLTNPTYLFEFKNSQTNISIYFISTDYSTAKNWYNKFDIIETDGASNLLNSTINLSLEGQYSYVIREQESTTNLDPLLSGSIVETGKVNLVGEHLETPTYNPIIEPVVYNG